MRSRLTAAAAEELEQAFHWYEARQSGLGHSFIEALDHVLEEITANPRTYPRVVTLKTAREIRHRSIGNFSYQVIYEVLAEEIAVLAIAHKHRKAYYWKRRRAQD